MYGQYRKGGEFEQRLRQEMLEEAQGIDPDPVFGEMSAWNLAP